MIELGWNTVLPRGMFRGRDENTELSLMDVISKAIVID